MILYDRSSLFGFIFRYDGSTLPQATIYASPSVALCMLAHYCLSPQGWLAGPGLGVLSFIWSVSFFTVSFLIGFRCNKAYARFWEGCSMLQQMSAEWFESASNLIAFSNMAVTRDPNDPEVKRKVRHFQAVLVRLMSLLHGVALHQIAGGEQEFGLIDVRGLDERSLEYIASECGKCEFNRVSVALHWIQVLISDNIEREVFVVPAPILSRSYQTLSRGMVNMHRVRMIADVPFPFPFCQCHVVMMLIQAAILPMLVAVFFTSPVWAATITFIPCAGMWSLTFICSELEQPFGLDANDLPLHAQQFDFNNTLLMLIDEGANQMPSLALGAPVEAAVLQERFRELKEEEADWKDESSTRIVNVAQQHVTQRDALRALNNARTKSISEKLHHQDRIPPVGIARSWSLSRKVTCNLSKTSITSPTLQHVDSGPPMQSSASLSPKSKDSAAHTSGISRTEPASSLLLVAGSSVVKTAIPKELDLSMQADIETGSMGPGASEEESCLSGEYSVPPQLDFSPPLSGRFPACIGDLDKTDCIGLHPAFNDSVALPGSGGAPIFAARRSVGDPICAELSHWAPPQTVPRVASSTSVAPSCPSCNSNEAAHEEAPGALPSTAREAPGALPSTAGEEPSATTAGCDMAPLSNPPGNARSSRFKARQKALKQNLGGSINASRSARGSQSKA